MNFFVEYTTLIYKWQYEMTRRLQELYPDANFVAMYNASSQYDKEIEDYIRNGGVRFVEIINGKTNMDRYVQEKDVDYDLLRRFEQTIPEKSLWRLIIIDRDWGSAWVKTSIRPMSHLHRINHNQTEVFKMCQYLIKFYEQLFTKYNIGVVLPSNGMNSINCAIMERVAKNRGAHYLVPETIRALGYLSFATNKEQNFPHLYPHYLELLNNPSADVSVGEQIYQRMMEDLKKEEYYDKKMVEGFRATTKLKYLAKIPCKVAQTLVEWIKNYPQRANTKTIFRQTNDWTTFWSNMRYAIIRPYQVMTLMNPKYFAPYDPDAKYVYFPLSSTPEHSTQVKAPMWVNQSVLIEALSKSLPVGWVLYVKEHPQNLLCRCRDFKFYDEIKSYPNVKMIATDTNFFEVIKKAQLVINITGTTGWQAIQFNKPVINFGDNFYDMLGLSLRCSDIESLSRDIHKAIAIARSVDVDERRRRMYCLLTALMKYSFWVDHPWKVMGEIPTDKEESSDIGRKIADSLAQYLRDVHQDQAVGKLANA